MDMSPAFISGYFEHFNHAALMFDKFHIVKMLNQTMDETRKGEAKDKKLLKGHPFTLPRCNKNLPVIKFQEIETLLVIYPELGKAYKFKEGFFDAFACATPEESICHLEQRCEAVKRTSLTHMKKFVNVLTTHWSGIITNFTCTGVNNGILEGLNIKIQLAKRRTRRFANIRNFIDMAYFVCGELKFDYPYNSL